MPCPYCNHETSPTGYYCSNCGKKIREQPVSVAFSGQLSLYFLSIFAAPFFIGRTIRYIKSSDKKTHIIGVISLTLTVATLVFASWSTYAIVSNVTTQVDAVIKQYGF